MQFHMPLSPRYRLDDERPWLVGIDPMRRYWIRVNGEPSLTVALAGLTVASLDTLRQHMQEFRTLQPGDSQVMEGVTTALTIHCVSDNCFAIATHVERAPVWHLFDQETLESLLMTAHPDWQCAPEHVHLGRKLLLQSWEYVAAA